MISSNGVAMFLSKIASLRCLPLYVAFMRCKEELLQRKGLNVSAVIITSDEEDPEWWADVDKLGLEISRPY